MEHNPDYYFVIGLVDRLPRDLQPSFWHPYELIPVEELNIPAFWDMAQKYDVVELNTAVKPFYIEHLYLRDPAVEEVIYLDPDIVVYSSLSAVTEKLRVHDIVLTPHSSTFDNSVANIHYEVIMLNCGIFNLGFIATSRSETTFAFLKWWRTRLRNHCFNHLKSGMFTDQLWVVLAPLYFPNIYIEKNPGYNMSYWNHFERRLSYCSGRYVVNEKYNLVFYHFSSYEPMTPDLIAKRAAALTLTFSERPDLKPIYDDYRDRLMNRDYKAMSSLKCSFGRKPPSRITMIKNIVMNFLRELLDILPLGFQKPVKCAFRYGRYLVTGRQLEATSRELSRS